MLRWKIIYLFLLVMLSCVSPTTTIAQYNLDSLLHQLETHTSLDTNRANTLNLTGFEYWTVDATKSEMYGTEALELSKKLNFLRGQAMAHRVIGVSHWARGNFYQALNHLFTSQEQYKSIHDKLGEANATLNIGLVFGDQMHLDRALAHYFGALTIFDSLKKEDRIAMTYAKIGSVYIDQKKYSESLEYLTKALSLHEKHNFAFGVLEVCNRLGLLYREQGDYAEAEKYFNRSLALAEQRNDKEHISKNLENLASIYLKQGNYAQAEIYLKRALPIASAYGYKKWLRDILHDLKELHTYKKDFRNALAYFEQYQQVRDSVFNEERAMQLANLQIEHEIAEREQSLKLRQQEILLLRQETKLNRLINFLLVGGITMLLTLGYFIFRNQRYRIKKNRELLESNHQLYQSKQALADVELENSKLREQELRHELEFKNKELTSYTVNFIRKNELLDELRSRITVLKNSDTQNISRELQSLINLVQNNQNIDRDWEDFKRSFENVHHNFFGKLLEHSPDLTSTELRLCALIKLNLNMKETAALMGISPDSVKTSRYRLRKKLNLPQETSLTDFVMGFQ